MRLRRSWDYKREKMGRLRAVYFLRTGIDRERILHYNIRILRDAVIKQEAEILVRRIIENIQESAYESEYFFRGNPDDA